MKTIKFNDLSMIDKSLLVTEFGVYLDSVHYYDYWIHLFSLGSHFVEVWANTHIRANGAVVEKIILVKYADIDKHLSNISLNLLKS